MNQSPIFKNFNLLSIDPVIKKLAQMNELDTQEGLLQEYGRMTGDENWIQKGFQANEYVPKFHTHNVKGERVDVVEYHPAYHELMDLAITNALHSLPWKDNKKGNHIKRMILYFMHVQNESGSGCPLTMTFSCVPAIKNSLPDADEWIQKILSPIYDHENKPFFEKKGLTIGMAMTEKQGGTDVRANKAFATPLAARGRGELYSLVGHKWFCSAPMCDAFLTLAQTEKGLSCFLFPRWKSDGSKNDFRIQRLKSKLGNKSNASSEIEFDGAHAWLLGEEGRGVPTIIEMVALTRYDCMIGSTALMRRALSEVLLHIQQRKVMGMYLKDMPLMNNVVTDLCLEYVGSMAMTYRAAQCLENAEDENEQLLLRLLTPIGKYWITKSASPFLVEAMECLGGNGYVEDNMIPRLYREAPVNAIWEGSGNVQCLDVLRAVSRSPKVLEVYMQELEKTTGKIETYDAFLASLKKDLQNMLEEKYARTIVGKMSIAMQACQVIQTFPEYAEAFCQVQLTDRGRRFYGENEDVSEGKILKSFLF